MRTEKRLSCWLFAVFALGSTALAGCGGSTETAADLGADLQSGTSDAGVDVADVPAVDALGDAGSPVDAVVDAAAGPDAVADVPVDVGLPVPATVPTDLPPGVVAIGLWAGDLDSKGASPQVKTQLPKNTVGVVATILGKHPNFFTLSTIVGPDGTPWAKGQCNALCVDCANRVSASPAVGTAALPSSSDVLVGGGLWRFAACGYHWILKGGSFGQQPPEAGLADVSTTLLVKTTSDGQLPTQGKLLLRLFFSGVGGITAASGPTEPKILGMIGEVQARYATLGIQVQVVDWRDLEAGHTLISLPDDVTDSGQSDMDTLFAGAKVAGGSGVIDVFLVDQILGGGLEGKGVTAGVSGAIPGPAYFHGIPRAGIAIALTPLGDDAVLAGRTLAHEMGHFLGLWHPCERDGKTFDPITDTPQCDISHDSSGDGILDPDECIGFGQDEVMFWFAAPGDAVFTPGQRAIIAANPLVLPLAATATTP